MFLPLFLLLAEYPEFLTSSHVFQLCSVVLMSGLIIILSSAAKITHQAQALTGHTTKWHACCTIAPVPDEEGEPGSNQNSMIEQDPSSDSDTESSEETGDEDLLENTKIHLPQAHVISFQKRQALGNQPAIVGLKTAPPHHHSPFAESLKLLGFACIAVTYLENNRAGITVFGFTLDRSYLHTIFMLEWTLFLWLLGKTIGFS